MVGHSGHVTLDEEEGKEERSGGACLTLWCLKLKVNCK